MRGEKGQERSLQHMHENKETQHPAIKHIHTNAFYICMVNMLLRRSMCNGNTVCVHAVLSSHSLWSGTKPWPGRSSRWTLLPPAWISSIARVCVMPWVASPLISTIWSPTCDAYIYSIFTRHKKEYVQLLFFWARPTDWIQSAVVQSSVNQFIQKDREWHSR